MKFRLTKDLDPLRSTALARLDEIVGERVYALTASPVAVVRARKHSEAIRWQDGKGAGPLLRVEAIASGRPVAEVVANILEKASAEACDLAEIEARRQRAQAAIRTAPHPAAIEAALEEFLNG